MKMFTIVLLTGFSLFGADVDFKKVAEPQKISEVVFWKLAKLASDDETVLTRQALINADRQAILLEICHTAKIEDLSRCNIDLKNRIVSELPKK